MAVARLAFMRLIFDNIRYTIIPNHCELEGHGKCTIFQVIVSLFELAFRTVIVECTATYLTTQN